MTDACLVSVVIPAYNYGRFLADSVDSALSQSYAPLEVLVVDDGSTDDTADVLSRYGSRIRVLRKANGGLSAARNTGIKAARGRYVAILDADDIWHPRKIELQMRALCADPSLGAVGCAIELVDAQCRLLSQRSFPAPSGARPDRLRNVLLRRQWIGGSGSGALIPVSILEATGGFDESLNAAEDWDLWLRIVDRAAVHNVPDHLVRIRLHQTGTFRNAEKMERNQWLVYRRALDRHGRGIFGWSVRQRAKAMILGDSAAERYSGTDYARAALRCLQAIAAWPAAGAAWRLLPAALLRCVLRPGAADGRR